MKKKLLTILFAGSFATAFAQTPTITSASNYKIGEAQVSYLADTVEILPLSGGENVMWDYSHLKRAASGDSVVSTYYAASSTQFASDFPSANMATNSVSGGAIAYYNISDTKVEMLGAVSNVQVAPVKQIYTNPHTIYTLPMTYNYNFTDKFAGEYTSNGMDVFRTGTSSVMADGYGTIKIGNRTFTDVLRLHNITQTRDSVNFGMSDIVSVIDLESWVYMTPSKKDPILTISHVTSTNNTTGQTTRGKTVTYNSRVASTSVKEPLKAFSALSVYPNPASNNCRITLKANSKLTTTIQLVNQLGQTVKSIENHVCIPGENNIDIDMSDVAKGVYFLQLRSNNGISTEKIIKN